MLSKFSISCKSHSADVEYRRLCIWTHVSVMPQAQGRKKADLEMFAGAAVIFSVRRCLCRARWFLTHRFGGSMNWLFSVKQFRGIRFSTSAASMSKASWWDIVANAALFSEPCWDDAVLGFHSDICLPKSCGVACTSAAGPMAVSRQGWQRTAGSELQRCQCFLRRWACWGRRRIFFIFLVFGSVQVFQKPKQSWGAPPPSPARERNSKWWSATWGIYPRLPAGRWALDRDLPWADDLPHHQGILLT